MIEGYECKHTISLRDSTIGILRRPNESFINSRGHDIENSGF
jgi:hypothetical protein